MPIIDNKLESADSPTPPQPDNNNMFVLVADYYDCNDRRYKIVESSPRFSLEGCEGELEMKLQEAGTDHTAINRVQLVTIPARWEEFTESAKKRLEKRAKDREQSGMEASY